MTVGAAGEPVICIRNLRMRFGENEVLKGIDLDIYKGQIIGYIGPNGAGKSTTVKLMLGILDGYDGEIRIFGEDIRNGSVEYKRRIGYVPESADVYESLTAQEYLTFVGELYGLDHETADAKASKLMSFFGIEDVYTSRISSYSRGMKQKLLIISSLLHDPDILFFDEPMSGLDANSVMVFKEIMSSLAARGKTIFYSSHIMDVVERISSRIILLNEGRIIADGTFDELKKNAEGSLEEIFNKLTGFSRHREIADAFVSVIEGKDASVGDGVPV